MHRKNVVFLSCVNVKCVPRWLKFHQFFQMQASVFHICLILSSLHLFLPLKCKTESIDGNQYYKFHKEMLTHVNTARLYSSQIKWKHTDTHRYTHTHADIHKGTHTDTYTHNSCVYQPVNCAVPTKSCIWGAFPNLNRYRL